MTDTATAPLFIQLSAEVLEDLHTGSGTGGGDIDALVQRDRHGRPVIRASHLKGLLREAGEELIALGTLTATDLNGLLGAGGSGHGALRLTSLRLPEGAAGKTLIWGSTKRVEKGRAPQLDTLRFIEHLAAGTRFEAQLRLVDARLQPLLERLLNRIDRIGGARNRGGGLVRLDWQVQPPETLTATPLPEGEGLVLRLVLRNLEPLCLPATGYPGNLIKSHSFIRGQTLRGGEDTKPSTILVPGIQIWDVKSGYQLRLGVGIPITRGREADRTFYLQFSNHLNWGDLLGRRGRGHRD